MYDVMDIMTEGRAKSCLLHWRKGETGKGRKGEAEKIKRMESEYNEKKENGLKHKLKSTH